MPGLAVTRALYFIRAGAATGFPLDHHPAEFPARLEIDVDRIAGTRPNDPRHHGVRRRGRERSECEIVEPDAALPARPGGDGDLDGSEALQIPVVGRTPGKRDLPLLAGDGRPLFWKDEIRIVRPPDVVTRRIDEFELKGVGRRLAPQVEREFVVRGQRERQRAMDHRITAVSMKIEIDAHRGRVSRSRIAMHRHLDALGRRSRPLAHRVESIRYYSRRDPDPLSRLYRRRRNDRRNRS